MFISDSLWSSLTRTFDNKLNVKHAFLRSQWNYGKYWGKLDYFDFICCVIKTKVYRGWLFDR